MEYLLTRRILVISHSRQSVINAACSLAIVFIFHANEQGIKTQALPRPAASESSIHLG
jgi:hypothetical protein